MGIKEFFGFNSVEKEQKKMRTEQAKVDKETNDAKIRRDLDIDQEVLNNQRKRLEYRQFRDKINNARSQLTMKKNTLRTRMVMEFNTVQSLSKQNRPMELLKSKQRVKKSYYYLIIINRFEERLHDIEDNYVWKATVKDLDETMKVMNTISGGTEKAKNFLYRVQVKKLEALSVDSTTQPFGSELLKPIDMLVSDEIFELLSADNSDQAIEQYVYENRAIQILPEEIMSEVRSSPSSSDNVNYVPPYFGQDSRPSADTSAPEDDGLTEEQFDSTISSFDC